MSLLDTEINHFLVHLRDERRASKHTCSNYQRDLEKLKQFFSARKLEEWTDLDARQARVFPATLHQSGLSSASIQRALSAARSFYRYLLREKKVKLSPFDGASAPKSKRHLPNTLTAEQVAHLVSDKESTNIAIRDRAIMELFYSSGLRLSELVKLDLGDIDFDEASVRVTGKGEKVRIVPVGRFAIEAINKWLESRPAMAAKDETAMFTSQRGTRLSTRAVQQRINYWAKRLGLDVRVHPHMLRHSFASHILQSSSDLRAVQELLGHSDISTTQIYTHLDFQHLAKVYDKTHPRAKQRIKQE